MTRMMRYVEMDGHGETIAVAMVDGDGASGRWGRS